MAERGRPWPLSALLVLLAVVVVARRWLDIVAVEGRSMVPTLLPGDLLLVERMTYRVRSPHPGDVVLAVDPTTSGREIVKRVAQVDTFGVTLRGDNAAASSDARAFGAVPTREIRWRVVFRYWPLARAGGVPPAPLTLAGCGEAAGAHSDAPPAAP